MSERKRVKAVMSIFRHARLHKLEKFVLFDASTSDYTQEDFLSDATSTENAGRGRRTKENLSDVEV